MNADDNWKDEEYEFKVTGRIKGKPPLIAYRTLLLRNTEKGDTEDVDVNIKGITFCSKCQKAILFHEFKIRKPDGSELCEECDKAKETSKND